MIQPVHLFRRLAGMLTLATGAGVLLPLGAQTNWGGPTIGYLFDAPSQSLRQVVGSLGSASLGPALLRGVAFAAVAPGRDYGIACELRNCSLISQLGSEPIDSRQIPGLSSAPEAIEWSADGSVAVLYSLNGGWLQVVRGLPASTKVEPPLYAEVLGGTLSSVAMSVQGRVALSVTGSRSGIFELVEGTFVALAPLENPTSLAFSADGSVLYALNGPASTVLALRLQNMTSDSWTLGAMQDPIALLAGRGESGRALLWVTGGNDRALAAFDRDSHELVEWTSLNFVPSGLEPFGEGGLLLTSRRTTGDLLWSFAIGRGVYFVPAPASNASTAAEPKGRRR